MKRFLPSLSALHAFEAAAIHLNFTRAGETLGMTQSGVSRQVNGLEKHLGVKLFKRYGPRLLLTDEGRTYVHAITKGLNALEEASIDLVRGSRSADALHIGVQDSLASQWLVPRMAGFLKRFPHHDFNMVPLSAEPDFRHEPIDVAVLRGHGAWADAHSYHLMDEYMTVVAAPSLIPIGTTVPPEEYHTFPLIQNAHRPDSWLRWLEAKNLTRQKHISGPRFSQTNMVIQAAMAGLGLGVVPTIMITEHLAQGSLHTPLGPSVASGFGYYIVCPLDLMHAKAVLDFRDWLIAETKPIRKKDLSRAS